MSENKITRDVYKHYASRIADVLKDDDFYQQFKKRVDKGSASFKLAKKRLIQDISIDWIDTIESILPNLDTIVRNPRKFIVQEEDIVDVSLARSISTESVKYLAQHTNMISKVDKNGDVTPSKILNITKEESFEIYENRFIYTLLLKLKDFVTMRYDKIKKASATQDVLELDVESRFNLPSKKVTYRTEYFAQLSFDEVMRLDPDTLTKIERVAKIDRIITDFLSSSFAKSMRNSAPVRPPIMRTNVILKEPNFKKALVLWQFIETYQATGGFSTSDEVEEIDLEDESTARLRNMVTLNTMLFESMYEQYETNLDLEDKQFADFLRVGEMDFEKDKIDRDEYAQKLEDEIENEEEQENIEEVKPQENEEAKEEIPPEQLEIQEIEKPHEIETEVVVEVPVEVERLKEMPPKAEQEEVDLEPDAEKFDQHLFEVRKIFKRPDDDKIKQEEIIKVKDAIDRCLTSYRRIKQEEIDERERQDRIRRRKEDIEKRAEAFRKQREALEQSGVVGDDSMFFGMDPFSYQKAKIAQEKREEELKARQNALKADKNENLELDDANTEEINIAIDEMEKDKTQRAAINEQIDKNLDALEDAILPVYQQTETEQSTGENADNTDAESANTVADSKDAEGEKVEQVAETADKDTQNDTLTSETDTSVSKPAKERKPGKIRIAHDEEIDPWAVQDKKPNKPKKNIEVVDESKVAVGGIRFADGSDVDNPFAGIGITMNRAETGREIAVEEPTEKESVGEVEDKEKETKKPRKPRAKKQKTGDTQEVSDDSQKANEQTSNEKEGNDALADQTGATSADGKDVDNSAEAKKDVENEAVKDSVVEENPDESTHRKVSVKNRQKYDPKAISATTLNQKYSKPSGKVKNFEAIDESKVAVGGIRFADGSSLDNPFGSAFGVTVNKAEKHESVEADDETNDLNADVKEISQPIDNGESSEE